MSVFAGRDVPAVPEKDLPPVPLDDAFRAALGIAAAAVSIVTLLEADVPHGSTVSAFGSLSMDPPMMFISLDNRSSLLPKLAPGIRLAVNVLAAQHAEIARQFARRGADKFTGVRWSPVHGAPALAERHALVSLSVAQLVPAGDHTMVLADVLAADVSAGDPLIYWRQTFGTHQTS